jgi:hypothetical protein
VTSVPDIVPPVKPDPANDDKNKYEERITKLEKEQLLIESKLNTQNELLQIHDDFIYNWIIPSIKQISEQIVPPKDRARLDQKLQLLLERVDNLFDTHEIIYTTRNASLNTY